MLVELDKCVTLVVKHNVLLRNDIAAFVFPLPVLPEIFWDFEKLQVFLLITSIAGCSGAENHAAIDGVLLVEQVEVDDTGRGRFAIFALAADVHRLDGEVVVVEWLELIHVEGFLRLTVTALLDLVVQGLETLDILLVKVDPFRSLGMLSLILLMRLEETEATGNVGVRFAHLRLNRGHASLNALALGLQGGEALGPGLLHLQHVAEHSINVDAEKRLMSPVDMLLFAVFNFTQFGIFLNKRNHVLVIRHVSPELLLISNNGLESPVMIRDSWCRCISNCEYSKGDQESH
mmetsp:Transcript_121928/g.182058  ORF Transcript_121928/g.182058 Transcript_121928/m.182058 type:complete len:290 (-) Transcript_121928:37-906(-)